MREVSAHTKFYLKYFSVCLVHQFEGTFIQTINVPLFCFSLPIVEIFLLPYYKVQIYRLALVLQAFLLNWGQDLVLCSL